MEKICDLLHILTVTFSIPFCLCCLIEFAHKACGSALRCSNLPFLASGVAFVEPLACHEKYTASKSNTSSEIEVNPKIDWIPNVLCNQNKQSF